MVKVDNIKKELYISGFTKFKDLVSVLSNDILYLDPETGLVVLDADIILEPKAILCLSSHSFIIKSKLIDMAPNSMLVLENGNYMFTNLEMISSDDTNVIELRSILIESNIDWETEAKYTIDKVKCNFTIYGDYLNMKSLNSVDKTIFISDSATDITVKSKFDLDVPFKSNDNIINIYDGKLESYKNLFINNKDELVTINFYGTKIISGYDVVGKIDLTHYLYLDGYVYGSKGERLPNINININDINKNINLTVKTDEYGFFSTMLPYVSIKNGKTSYHVPYNFNYNGTDKKISFNENIENLTLVSKTVNADELILLIERINNKLDNNFSELKNGLATVLYNSEKPIKNVAPVTLKGNSSSLTINQK